MEGGQRPLELILARNFLASISTPAFLIDGRGEVAFYNEAAGTLLGRRYEDSGPMPLADWTAAYGPFDMDENRINFDDLPLTQTLRGNRPAHARFKICALDHTMHVIEASALPIYGSGGYRGALVVFWPVDG